MDWTTTFSLLVAGIAGGIVNAMAGGATLITFPAMMMAGLPAITANASNAVAISPGHIVAVLADRSKLPPRSVYFTVLCLTSLVCGAIGARAVLALPERLFTLPVPALIAFATVLFALAPSIQAWASRNRSTEDCISLRMRASVIAATSLYGGFFGAGLGVMLTAVLSIVEVGDIRTIKALKNVLASCVSLAAVVTFVGSGAVAWPPTVVMLGGALIGGYLGGYLIRVLPAAWVRHFVIVAGVLMSIIYARQYWF
ncbi:sulfite exporter TauE/SafE family protein [Paraburkholderia caledonica]|uniref:sulfite exporter TauE/SafE family protein n=1 Tax=Paraburkholderia caledonica TaxID=134536 RepID=UPI000B3FAB0E|nr:sulfite exporter TauE/SafE family protein [Paraburkholderia caledonica]